MVVLERMPESCYVFKTNVFMLTVCCYLTKSKKRYVYSFRDIHWIEKYDI